MNIKKDKNIVKLCLISILILYYLNILTTAAVNKWAVMKKVEGYVKILIDIDTYVFIIFRLATPILVAIIIWKVILIFYYLLENK